MNRGLVTRVRLRIGCGKATPAESSPPFIRRHVTKPPVDDPFRSRPLVTLSSASSALGILNLITNCPNARHQRPPCLSLSPLLFCPSQRGGFRVSSRLAFPPSCPHSQPPVCAHIYSLSPPSLLCHSSSRVLVCARSDEKLFVARSRRNYWPAGFIYSIHFPWKSRRNPSPAVRRQPFFSLFFSHPFLVSLIAYLFCICDFALINLSSSPDCLIINHRCLIQDTCIDLSYILLASVIDKYFKRI